MSEAPEAGDHFIEDQKNTVLIANLAQPLKIADRWHQTTCGAGNRLDEYGANSAAAIGFAVTG